MRLAIIPKKTPNQTDFVKDQQKNFVNQLRANLSDGQGRLVR